MKHHVCVIVIALVAHVTANPYGYGIKGGATARAQSGALSGASIGYVPAPLSIPSGSYSGSFSKSSSSSFASSSASASSSSFSYSGSGVIPNHGSNIVQAGVKCSGNCETENYGNTGQSYSGANAAAGANAGAIVYPGSYAGQNVPCAGGACNNKPPCVGSQCRDDQNSDKKCVSGNCGSPTATYGANDIPVFVSGATSILNNDKINNNNLPSCSYGNCGAPSNPKSPNTNIAISKPSTYLVTPKEDAPCTTPDCAISSDNLYNNDKPSSYNVPIHGGYENSKVPINCASGNCAVTPSAQTSKPTTSDSDEDFPDFVPLVDSGKTTTTTTSLPKYSTFSQGSTTKESFLDNGVYNTLTPVSPTTQKSAPYSGNFGGPPGVLKPNEFSSPSKIPTTSNKPGNLYQPVAPTGSYKPDSPTCTYGNCASSSESGPNSSYKPNGLSGPYKPNSSGLYNPIDCSSGKCATDVFPEPTKATEYPTASPTGCSGNCGSSSPQYQPSIPYKPIAPTGIFGASECSSGNCKPLQQGPFTTSQTLASTSYIPSGPSGTTTPTGCSSGICDTYKPTAPSGLYSPSLSTTSPSTGCISGNCGTQSSQPLSQYGQSGSYNPTGPTGSYRPTGCSTGNCGSQSNPIIPQYGTSNKPIESSGTYKPTSPTGSYNPTVCPYGINCASISTQASSNIGQSGSYNPSAPAYQPSGPSGSYSPSVCSSGSCATQTGVASPQYVQNDSYKPTASNNPSGTYGTYGPTACAFGNCGPNQQISAHVTSQPIGSQYKPLSPPAFGAPNGVLSPIGPSGSYNPTTCSSGKCSNPSHHSPGVPQYTPVGPAQGFGGPPGILSPNEFKVPSGGALAQYKPVTPTSQAGAGTVLPTGSHTPCTAGNCAPHPGQTSTSHFIQSGSSSAQAVAAASASSNSIYIGGFGGPPGLLNPYDDGKIPSNVPAISTGAIVGSGPSNILHSSYGKSLNGGFDTGDHAGSAALGVGGNKGQISSDVIGGCKGGCGSVGGYGVQGTGASKSVASAVSGANAGGYSNSFASSSASAHASAGAAVKSSYGKR